MKKIQSIERENAENQGHSQRSGIGHFLNGCEKLMIIRVGHIPSHWLRMLFYRYVFRMALSKNVVIYSGCRFRKPSGIEVGEGSVIGDNNWIDGRGYVKIGKNCNLSSEVRIWSEQHQAESKSFLSEKKPVVIDDHVWISSNAIILPGVHIGEGAVIAAGAVVTRDIAAHGIYAGIPAKRIHERIPELNYQFTGKHDWFM